MDHKASDLMAGCSTCDRYKDERRVEKGRKSHYHHVYGVIVGIYGSGALHKRFIFDCIC